MQKSLLVVYLVLAGFFGQAQTIRVKTNISQAELQDLQVFGLDQSKQAALSYTVVGDTLVVQAKGWPVLRFKHINYQDSSLRTSAISNNQLLQLRPARHVLEEVTVANGWHKFEVKRVFDRIAYMNQWMVMSIPVDVSNWNYVKSIRLGFKHLSKSDTVQLNVYNGREAVLMGNWLDSRTHIGNSTFTIFDRLKLEALSHTIPVHRGDTLIVEIKVRSLSTLKPNAFKPAVVCHTQPEKWPVFIGLNFSQKLAFQEAYFRRTQADGYLALAAEIVYR